MFVLEVLKRAKNNRNTKTLNHSFSAILEVSSIPESGEAHGRHGDARLLLYGHSPDENHLFQIKLIYL